MSDNMQELQRDSTRAREAQALLDNTLLNEVFDYLRKSYVEAWQAARDNEKREENWHNVHAIDRIKEHLATVVANGRMAQEQIEQLVKVEQRRKLRDEMRARG